jgi:hypothetical protein
VGLSGVLRPQYWLRCPRSHKAQSQAYGSIPFKSIDHGVSTRKFSGGGLLGNKVEKYLQSANLASVVKMQRTIPIAAQASDQVLLLRVLARNILAGGVCTMKTKQLIVSQSRLFAGIYRRRQSIIRKPL